jgi:hypothetical protein
MTTLTSEIELGQASQRLIEALIAGDLSALDQLVVGRCRIVGPKGYHISKRDWIQAHASDVYEQAALETVESDTVQYGGTAIPSDLQRSECLYRGEHITGLYRVMAVWVRNPQDWQLAALRYTTVSPEAGSDHDGAP